MAGRAPGNGPVLAGMMVDLKADARPGPWPDQVLLKNRWRPAWRDWLLVVIVVSLLASVIALLLWLP